MHTGLLPIAIRLVVEQRRLERQRLLVLVPLGGARRSGEAAQDHDVIEDKQLSAPEFTVLWSEHLHARLGNELAAVAVLEGGLAKRVNVRSV